MMQKDTDGMDQVRYYECQDCFRIFVLERRGRCPHCESGATQFVAKVFITQGYDVTISRP